MKTKVRWTTRELGLIAEWFIKHGIRPGERGFSAALGKAQQDVLPAERHRSCVGLTPKTRDGVQAAIEGVELRTREPLPEHKSWTPPTPTADTLSTEDLLVELARRIAKMLDRIDNVMMQPQIVPNNPADRGFHPAPKHDPDPSLDKIRVQKLRFLIVGPKGHQQELLRKEFPTFLLHFVTCESNPNQCSVGRVDEAILWTKFMNHAQQDAVKKLGYQIWYANSMAEIEARLRSHG